MYNLLKPDSVRSYSSVIHRHLKSLHGAKARKIHKILDSSRRKQYDNLRSSFIRNTPVSTTIWTKAILPISKIPLAEITSRIGNLCKFSCPTCESRYFQCYSGLRQHIKLIHQSGIKYSSSLLSGLARCHACLLCPMAMLGDRYIIAAHLAGKHKISIKEYERIFQRNGGKTLPTYTDWIKSEEIKNSMIP